jgi:hypothetical protein
MGSNHYKQYLKELVRVDFVFSCGRMAISGIEFIVEPLDRDASYVTDRSRWNG